MCDIIFVMYTVIGDPYEHTVSASIYDFLTVKYAREGNTEWIRRYNGAENDDDIVIFAFLRIIIVCKCLSRGA
jgi:hypothetical protein